MPAAARPVVGNAARCAAGTPAACQQLSQPRRIALSACAARTHLPLQHSVTRPLARCRRSFATARPVRAASRRNSQVPPQQSAALSTCMIRKSAYSLPPDLHVHSHMQQQRFCTERFYTNTLVIAIYKLPFGASTCQQGLRSDWSPSAGNPSSNERFKTLAVWHNVQSSCHMCMGAALTDLPFPAVTGRLFVPKPAPSSRPT